MKNTYANKPNTLQGFTSLYPYTKPSIKYSSKQQAFTIVELLIVIVVIAILAAISIAAYTNMQQRAKNTAIINAASQSLKMIEAYIAENGTYPWKSGYVCVTYESGCQVNSASAESTVGKKPEFEANLATIGVLPKSVPIEGDRWYGITYIYSSAYEFNGASQPALLRYHLTGMNQQCGLSGVMQSVTGATYVTSTTGYTGQDGGLKKTTCLINIPGPAHS